MGRSTWNSLWSRSGRRLRASKSAGPVLAIDPGTGKCGLAVVAAHGEAVLLEIVPTAELRRRVDALSEEYLPIIILLGDGTSRAGAEACLAGCPTPLQVVSESHTTLRGRRRYWQDHPPRGWRRLLPTSLQTPPRPWDDYAALMLAEDYLERDRGDR